MKLVEIRDIDAEELLIRVAELKEELFNLRFQMATGQLDNHRRMRLVKRDIARIKTVLREREIEAYYAQSKAPAVSVAEVPASEIPAAEVPAAEPPAADEAEAEDQT